MPRPPNPRNWTGEDVSKLLTAEATPPASLSLLAAADHYALDAAVAPYCGCARLFDGLGSATLAERYIGQMVAPGAVHARGAITQTHDGTATAGPFDNLSWTNTGGTSGVNVVYTYESFITGWGRAFGLTDDYKGQAIVETGADIDDAPTNPPTPATGRDRQYELQTLAYPYVEPMYVKWAAGFSVVVSQQLGDLEGL